MRVYIAAKWEAHDMIQNVVKPRLESLGYTIVSEWHDMTKHRAERVSLPYDEQMKNKGWMLEEAYKDLRHIDLCDVVIVDQTIPSSTGGREVEIGYIYGKGKNFCLIGPRRNPFHWLAVTHYETWEDLFNTPGHPGK